MFHFFFIFFLCLIQGHSPEAEQEKFEQISSLTSQLEIHLRVQDLEKKKKKDLAEEQRRLKEEELKKKNDKAIRDEQVLYEHELETDETVRRAMVQDVIDEAKDNGIPLPPAVIKLINHHKSKIFIITM